MRVRRYAVPICLLLLSAVSLCGCQLGAAAVIGGTRMASKESVTMKAQYTIGNRPIVVIPFRDQYHTYYESRDGVDLATFVVGELAKHDAATNVRPDTGLREAFAGRDLATVGWDKVAEQAGAELVLVGTIERFRLKDPKTYLMMRGNCIVNCFLYDAKTKVVVHRIPRIEVWYPETGQGIAESDVTDQERFRETVLSITALKIVQHYYTWEQMIRPEPRRF